MANGVNDRDRVTGIPNRAVRTEVKEMRDVCERFVQDSGEGDGSVAWL